VSVFLDQSLRKAILSKIRDAFSLDEILAGKVKILDQETFLPEAENQVILTDLQLSNDSLDSGNRVTTLNGRVTFAPIGEMRNSFIFWAQENIHQKQVIDQGFYQLKIKKVPLTVSTPSSPDASWEIAVNILKRVTEKRNNWSGLKIDINDFIAATQDFDPSLISIQRGFEVITPQHDYHIVGGTIILRRFVPDTRVFYNQEDITAQCFYLDLVNKHLKFRNIMPPINFGTTIIPESLSIYNLTLQQPLSYGWSLNPSNVLTWMGKMNIGTEVLIQYYQKKPLMFWEIPSEYVIPLEADPLVYSDGKTSLMIISNVRGLLSPSTYEIKDNSLRILEPLPDESVTVDYRYFYGSLGPFPVQPASIDDQIIPGLVLTFTDNFSDGAECVVIKYDHHKAIGQEMGGNNKVELSIKLRSADDKTLERMTSRTFFLFTDIQSLYELTSQGISLENTVSYVRTYEERDANGDKWIINTFRLTVHHTWRYLIPYVSDLNTLAITTGIIMDPGDVLAKGFEEVLVSTYYKGDTPATPQIPYWNIGAGTARQRVIRKTKNDWVQGY